MKKAILVGVAIFLAMVASGCGDDDGRHVTNIVSEGGAFDGDITNAAGTYSVVTSDQFAHTILVNFDPASETRGFITFSLAGIPESAFIRSATVFLPILRATPTLGNLSVTLLPDMVSFPPLNTLTTQIEMGSVFDTTAILQGPSFAVFADDAGFDVTFDATDAVVEAIRPPALPTLQIRVISSGGEVEIDDLLDPVTGGGTPLLRVEWS